MYHLGIVLLQMFILSIFIELELLLIVGGLKPIVFSARISFFSNERFEVLWSAVLTYF